MGVDEETQLTPLGRAVKNGSVEAADELLKANAPLSRVHPRTGHDILHMACDSGQYQIERQAGATAACVGMPALSRMSQNTLTVSM